MFVEGVHRHFSLEWCFPLLFIPNTIKLCAIQILVKLNAPKWAYWKTPLKTRSWWFKKIFKRNRSPCYKSTSDFFIKKIYHDTIRESLSTFPFFLWLFSEGCVKTPIMGLWRTLQVSQLVGVFSTPSMTIYPGITLYQWSAYIFADLYTYAWTLLFSFNNTSYLFHLKILTPNFLLY